MKIDTSRLISGMTLSQELSRDGMVLLNKGAVLSEATINIIKKRGIVFVDIEEDESIAAHIADALENDQGELSENPDYVNERNELIELFSTIDEQDEQMSILKFCLLSRIEEKYRDKE